ncbi:hypothetical protein LCGC14_3036860, partial [marine sediment metagenome]
MSMKKYARGTGYTKKKEPPFKVKDTGEVAELELLYNMGLEPVKPEEISLALKGKANISNNIREIMRNAKKEVIICTNVKEVISKIKLFQQTFDLLKKFNVKINMALSGDTKLIKQLSDKLQVKFKKINVNAKF